MFSLLIFLFLYSLFWFVFFSVSAIARQAIAPVTSVIASHNGSSCVVCGWANVIVTLCMLNWVVYHA